MLQGLVGGGGGGGLHGVADDQPAGVVQELVDIGTGTHYPGAPGGDVVPVEAVPTEVDVLTDDGLYASRAEIG